MVQPGKSKLGPDYQLIGLIRISNVGGDTRSSVISVLFFLVEVSFMFFSFFSCMTLIAHEERGTEGKTDNTKASHLPDCRVCIYCLEGFWTLGQIETIEFVIPDIHKAKLVVGYIVVGTLEQRSRYVDIRLSGN